MRIAVLSDVHSNYIALKMVIDDAQKRGVDDFWFLGDAVGYGWQPLETLDSLGRITSMDNWVIGNHDALYANRLHPGGFRVEAQIMMIHNRLLMDAEKKKSPTFAKLIEDRFSADSRLPKQKYIDGTVYFLTHNGFDWNKYDYYFFDTSLPTDTGRNYELFGQTSTENLLVRSWQFWRNMDSEPRVLFLGHTHLPVVAYMDLEINKIVSLKVRRGVVDLKKDCKTSGTVVINPGSVGFPKDRWHYPSYVLLDTKKRQVEFCRVMEYDYREVDQGYRAVKKNIKEYIQDGLWKPVVSNNHNGESFTKYDIGKMVAQDYVGRIEQELLDAPHPRNDFLRPDFRKFYAGDFALDLSERIQNGN
ncbi:MAG: metallophosphoesterase family protein [Methylococcales bacterium]|nr:metallophosphoesterase family protein [Methylococcales bacterium]